MLKVTRILLLSSAVGLTACVGSETPRSPNRRRPASVVRSRVGAIKPWTPASLVQPYRVQTPDNAWLSHDREVYRVLGEGEAKARLKVYPWLGGAAAGQ